MAEPAVEDETAECIDDCLACYELCLSAAMTRCLELGGEHLRPDHFRMMMACAEICRTAAHFMLINTEFRDRVCGVCADICEACADACDALEGMEDCAAACRRCADSCGAMAA